MEQESRARIVSVKASSTYFSGLNAAPKCVDGRSDTFYCSAAHPELPVVLNLMLAGHYHVHRIGFAWKYDGASSYEVLATATGNEWTTLVKRSNLGKRVEEEVEVSERGRQVPVQQLRLVLLQKNHAKYVGLQEIRIEASIPPPRATPPPPPPPPPHPPPPPPPRPATHPADAGGRGEGKVVR